MKDRLMNKIADESFDLGEFCIYLAKYREIGADWSRIEYFPYYRLYYIYDSVDAHITLKSETVALLPRSHVLYSCISDRFGKRYEFKTQFYTFCAESREYQYIGTV